MNSGQSLIELKNVTARVRNRPILPATCWKIEAGHHWAVIGPNGSGKSTLVGILAGRVPVIKGQTLRRLPPGAVRSLSFEMVDRLAAREEMLDEARHFANRPDETTTVRDVIQAAPDGETAAAVNRLAETLGISHLLDAGFGSLSTGEIRKVLLARAMISNPRLLILDEPYEGLDTAASETLARTIPRLMQNGTCIVLVTHQLDRISPHFTHVLHVKSGRVVAQGPREKMLAPGKLAGLYGRGRPRTQIDSIKPTPGGPAGARELLCLQDTTVRYGDKIVLQ